jgi:hypothetical protein
MIFRKYKKFKMKNQKTIFFIHDEQKMNENLLYLNYF